MEREQVIFHNKKEGEVDWQKNLRLVERIRKIQETMELAQLRATVEIQTDRPISIIFFGDTHIGGEGTEHSLLIKNIRKAHESEGVFQIWMGDTTDDFTHPAATPDQVVTPEFQGLTLKSMAEYLNDSMLTIVTGNHESFMRKYGSMSFENYFYPNISAPIFLNKGLLNLKVGEQNYKLWLVHKSRYYSYLNPFHCVMRERGLHCPDADIVAVGHTHEIGVESHRTGWDGKRREFIGIRTGCYKTFDRWAQHGGFERPDTGSPAVILFPDKKLMLPFSDFNDALAVNKTFRRRRVK